LVSFVIVNTFCYLVLLIASKSKVQIYRYIFIMKMVME